MFAKMALRYEPLPLPDRTHFSNQEMQVAADAFYDRIRRRHTVGTFRTGRSRSRSSKGASGPPALRRAAPIINPGTSSLLRTGMIKHRIRACRRRGGA